MDRAPAVANWSRLYDETLAKLTGARSGEDILTLPETLNRLSDPTRTGARRAAHALATALEADTPTLAPLPQHHRLREAGRGPLAPFADPAAAAPPRQRGRRRGGRRAGGRGGRGLSPARPPLLRAEGQGHGQATRWTTGTATPRSIPTQPRRYGWDEAKAIVLEAYASLAPRLRRRRPRPSSTTPGSTPGPRAGKRRAPIPTR